MRFPWSKGKFVPRSFSVPDPELRRIFALIDARKAAKDASHVARYELWLAIAELFPETAVGDWRYECTANSCDIIENHSK